MAAGEGVGLTAARLGRGPRASLIEALNVPGLKKELSSFGACLTVDLAHVTMLAEQRLLPAAVARPLLQCLAELREAGAGSLVLQPELGSLLLQIERHIATRCGPDIAGMLQLARSRIDQNSAINRVAVRDGLIGIIDEVLMLQAVLHERAGEWRDVIMPGYTHLQHAQPWVLGHYLLAQFDVFSRDIERLFQVYERVNLSALGGAALSGTSWNIDRWRVAALLGHPGILRNSKDAGHFAMEIYAETAGSLAILLSGLGRLASELYIWSSWEFGMVELDEGLCGTSSIMPQKKNAYALERVRALAGESVGWMAVQLGLLKTPTTTDNDVSFSTGQCGGYFEATRWALRLMTDSLRTLRVNTAEMERRAGANWSTASNLADEIVRQCGLDFRHAHHVVAALVRRALEQGRSPSDMRSQDVDAAAQETLGRPLGLGDVGVSETLDARKFVASRSSEGAVSPGEVGKLLQQAAADLAAMQVRAAGEHERLHASCRLLDQAVRAITQHPQVVAGSAA